MGASSEEMSNSARHLQGMVARFRIGEDRDIGAVTGKDNMPSDPAGSTQNKLPGSEKRLKKKTGEKDPLKKVI